MKMKQKLLVSALALSGAVAATPAAYADAAVAATVGASNMYYWRGFDLGGGAALSADVNVSSNGFVAGIWTSSGDDAADGLGGTEYDLYAGYSGAAGDFTYGLSVISYNYPTLGENAVKPGEYVELVPFVGYGPFKLTYYDAVVADHAPLSDKTYSYVTAELNFAKFGFKYGQHMTDDGASFSTSDDVSHFDAIYKYNDKLSFTVGKIIDDNDGAAPDEVNFVVNLSLPIQ